MVPMESQETTAASPAQETTIQETPTKVRPDFADWMIVLACGTGFAVLAVCLCVLPLVREFAAGRDYVVFWATGQQLAHGGNPFDAEAMGRIEHGAGFTVPGSYYMRNPPWTLPLTLPLGWLSLRLGSVPWMSFMLGCFLLSVYFLWDAHGRPKGSLHLIAFSFAPAILCVQMGQTSVPVLLGLVLFLRWCQRRPFAAGAALWLCTLKPHLLLPFACVVLLWIVYSRSYRVLWGALSALAFSILATTALAPRLWMQYFTWMHTSGVEDEKIYCLSSLLRYAIRPSAVWIAWIPVALSCVWAIVWFWMRRREWDWQRQGSVVALASLLFAPYAWIYDQPLALPALMQALFRTRSRWMIAALAISSIAIQAELFSLLKIGTPYYWWASPFYLGWYMLAIRLPKRTETVEAA